MEFAFIQHSRISSAAAPGRRCKGPAVLALLGAGALVLSASTAPAQSPARVAQGAQLGTDNQIYQAGGPVDPGDPAMRERRMNALNVERQKSLVNDTNKLVKLARELNSEINSPHPSELTSDQLRQLVEIEKLARSIKQNMSYPVNGPGIMPPSLGPMIPPPLFP